LTSQIRWFGVSLFRFYRNGLVGETVSEEVRQALLSKDKDNARGPDGFTIAFFFFFIVVGLK